MSKPVVRKLGLLPLLAATYFMVSGGPSGLEDIIGAAGYGRALLVLVLLPLVWSLPTALLVGELASAIPEEGGFYAWVRRALGPFWGFQEAWLSLASSVFDMAVYPTIIVSYLGHVAPGITAGHRGLLMEIGIVVLVTLWNLRGAVAVGEGSVLLWCVAISPFLLLTGLAVWFGLHTRHAVMGRPVHLDLPTAITVAMWNYMGWDNASTIANEVENPQRTYPRVMLLAALMVIAIYLLPVAAVAWAGIPAERFSTGAWADAALLLGGAALAVSVAMAGSLDSLGTFNALTLSYTRLPYAMARDSLLPAVFTRHNAHNVPWVALLACATCWALALGFTFERLIIVDVALWGMSLLLELAALLVLRRNEPELPRPFRIPGSTWVAGVMAVGPVALVAYAIYATRNETMAGIPAIVFTLLIAAAGVPAYALARWRRRRFT